MQIKNLSIIAALAASLLSTSVNAQNWPSETNPEWDALLAAGLSDSELVIVGDPSLSNDFIEQFEADTGINVLYVSGSSRETLTRFTREVESGAPTVDILLGGPNTFPLLASGQLMAISPVLVLPEVTDPSNWRRGKIPFADPESQYLPVPSSYLSGRVLVNSNMVDPATITTWDDLLRPEFEGKIISQFAPTFGGGLSLAGYLMQEKGADFVEDFYLGQNVDFTREYRMVTDSVARGSYAIGLSAVPNDIARFQNEGIDFLAVLDMADVDGYIVGGSSVISVAANGPNPNASAVFANWYLSKNGQEAFSAARNVPSERLDVVDGGWPKSIEPLVGRDYFDTYDLEWRLVGRRPLQDAVNEILGND